MKLLNLTILVLFTSACNLNKSNDKNENTIKANTSIDNVRLYAQSLLVGGNSLSFETAQLNLQMFDSINSPIDSTRVYYLNIAKFLIKRGDALLDVDLGRNLITLINDRPREFIESFSKADETSIRDVGTTIGAYIANHAVDKEKETNNIEEILSKNIQINIPVEVNFKKKVMPVIQETTKTLNHS